MAILYGNKGKPISMSLKTLDEGKLLACVTCKYTCIHNEYWKVEARFPLRSATFGCDTLKCIRLESRNHYYELAIHCMIIH